MGDFRQCFLGNIPFFMEEDDVIEHIVHKGFDKPLKVKMGDGKGDNKRLRWGIATFKKAESRQRMEDTGLLWPDGKYALIK